MLIKDIDKSWRSFLTKEMVIELNKIETMIGTSYTPDTNNILRFMRTDLSKKKICIIGQDPYYQVIEGEKVAVGRAFQPGNLSNWNQSYRQVSLKNIIRLINRTYFNIDDYKNIKRYKQVLTEINDGSFPILQPKEWFDSLERQGVLLINAYLTTEIGQPNKHRKIWEKFSQQLIKYIQNERPDLIWFLWGNESKSMSKYIKKGKIYSCRHPMMCSNKYEDDFLKSNCFRETQSIINWLG